MAKTQKKTAKGRLDKYYKLAKEQGYRSRAAFKLIQLAKKYNFLEKAKVVIDLCAAPGGWLQVASKQCKPGALIVGVDLVPIKPIPNVITFAEDINSEKCRAQLRQYLKTWKADCVIHDGAPNVGTAWLQDAYSQAELVLMSLKLACEFLIPGGTFVTKVFRSKDYNNLIWVFNQLFGKVEATKPQASRNVSAEIFVVCRNFKAPQKLDPKLLDPRAVFEDLPEPTPNQEAKVFHPERRKRQREGYDEGNYTQHTILPISEFVKALDPIEMLGITNQFTFAGGPDELKLKEMDSTTAEIVACAADLRVLGKKDFRNLLRWRIQARELMGLGPKQPGDDEETVAVEPIDEEELIDAEIEKLGEDQKAHQKREKRKTNERKQKELTRMQMGMASAMDIGAEQYAPTGSDAMFALQEIEKRKKLGKISEGDVAEADAEETPESEDDEEEIDLEDQLDLMYDHYKERKASSDAKFRAKKARKEKEDDEWHGLDEKEENSDGEEDENETGNDALSDSEDDDESDDIKLSTSLTAEDDTKHNGLSKKAALFFDQDLFKGIIDSNSEETKKLAVDGAQTKLPRSNVKELKKGIPKAKKEEPDFEEVAREADDFSDDDDDNNPRKKGKSTIDIVTAEAMTLAQSIASKQKSKSDLIDDGFNKWAFQDKEGVPEWFLDDERVHNKPNLPITKEAADALREKMRAMNARPIKKILEAQGRKKQRALRTLQKINQKADAINDTGDMSERQKAQSITRLLNRAAKSKPKAKVQVVVAKGGNRGVSGRPKNVTGKYKMVDSRMKKETRAMKRVNKKAKKARN